MHSARGAPAHNTRRAENRWRYSKIQRPRGDWVRKRALPAQTCCGCDRCAATNHRVFQLLEICHRTAARERFRRIRSPAILAFLGDATPERQSRLKRFFLETAMLTRHLATPRRSCFGCAAQVRRQMRGYSRCSSLALRVFAVLPSRRQGLRQFQERARLIPCRTRAMEAAPSLSLCASTTKHRTSSRNDSQTHFLSTAEKNNRRFLKDQLVSRL
jgi:hypothetical protein